MKTADDNEAELRAPSAKVKFYITETGSREWVVMWSGGGYLDTANQWIDKVCDLPISGWYPYRTSSRLGDGKRHVAQVGWHQVSNGNIKVATDRDVVNCVKTLFDDVVEESRFVIDKT